MSIFVSYSRSYKAVSGWAGRLGLETDKHVRFCYVRDLIVIALIGLKGFEFLWAVNYCTELLSEFGLLIVLLYASTSFLPAPPPPAVSVD